MVVSFAVLEPDLLRERLRPGGKAPPLSLRLFSLVLFLHWIVAGLDRGRFIGAIEKTEFFRGSLRAI